MTDEQFEKLMEKLEEISSTQKKFGNFFLVFLVVAGITILCLQDAPLWSVNSIVPALMIGLPIVGVVLDDDPPENIRDSIHRL